MEPVAEHSHEGVGPLETSHSGGHLCSDAPPSILRPPLPHRSNIRAASVRAPKTPAFRGKALSIDVNVPDPIPQVAMASPLALFHSKKPTATTTLPHSSTGATTDHQFLPQLLGSPFLEYGMVISLVCDDRNSIVCAEGFASREVRLERLNYGYEPATESEEPSRMNTASAPCKLGLGGHEERRLREESGQRLLESPFRDCLFEIVPKMTYDATTELEDLSASQLRDKKPPQSFRASSSHAASGRRSAPHSLADLKFKSDAEMRLNAMMYRKLKGTQVVYGHSVQFRHVKTGQYLCLDASPLRFRGSEYAQVCLDKGQIRAHFTILPRFKLRSKGAPVQLTDQLLLTSGTDDQPFSLYASNRQSSDSESSSVVGSCVHSSQWRAVLFDKADDLSVASRMKHESGIRAGSCVRLLHLESTSWLQFGPRRPHEPAAVSLQFREDAADDNANDENASGSSYLSSDSLWVVEKATIYEGGAIKWRDSIFLRHLVSNNYLAVEQSSTFSSSPVASSRSPVSRSLGSSVGLVVATGNPHAFMLMPTAVTDDEDAIDTDAVAFLQHQRSKCFVHSPETHASTMTDIRISSKALVSGDSNGSAFSVTALPGARDEDAFRIVTVAQSEVDDTLLLLSYKRVLQQFIAPFDSTAASGVFDREDTLAMMLHVEEAIDDLIKFCVVGAKHSLRVHRLRQSMFRSHLFIDLLMAMIKAPFDRFGGPFSIDAVSSYNPLFTKQSRSADDPDGDLADNEEKIEDEPVHPSGGEATNHLRVQQAASVSGGRGPKVRSGSRTLTAASSSKFEIHEQAMHALNRIIPSVNSLLVHIFCGHRPNEVYTVQSAMPILMELLGNGFQTSLPLSYLLRENRNLVESITAYGCIIRNFFELIKSRGRSIRYMQFLVALCTSRGRGVPKTQEAICELLFNESNGFRDFVILPIRPKTNGFEVFVPSSKRTTPSTSSNHHDEAQQHHTKHGNWIGLATLYQDYYLQGKHRGLGQYCYGLLQLYVVLCLDRNYVSIDYVQQTFPRNNLLHAVKDPALSRSVRAVLLDLIRVAYVDCEPQKTLACPCYTRIWTEVGDKGEEVALPSISTTGYSADDLSFFSQLKQLCSSFFSSLRGKIVVETTPENQLLLAMLKVCKKMVEFGMYSSHHELSMLVCGLVDLLDERTDVSTEIVPVPTRSFDTVRSQLHGRRWFGGKTQKTQDDSRHRQDSVTDGANNLFTTMMVTVPFDADSIHGVHSHGGDVDVPMLLRLRNSALLDGAISRSTSSIMERERSIARQYGMDSLLWTQHFSGTYVLRGPSSTSSADPSNHIQGGPGTSQSRAAISHHGSAASTHTPAHEPTTPTTAKGHHHEQHEQRDWTAINRVFMEIKDEICAILQLVDNLRLDHQISVFLSAFRSQYGDTNSLEGGWRGDEDDDDSENDLKEGAGHDGALGERSSVDDRLLRPSSTRLSTEKASPLAHFLFGKPAMECKFSLSQLSRRNVTTVLMQMLMYEYPPLVSKSLELVLQQFNQHDQLLTALQHIQLLVSEETITIYNRLKDDVNDLRRLSETTEVWMDLTSKSDFENAEWACALLRTIRGVITKNSPLPGNGSSSAVLKNELMVGVTPGSAAHHHFQRRTSSGILPISSRPDAVVHPVEPQSYAPHILAEKSPPNRKKRQMASVYALQCVLGRVSRHSSCHDLLPMAKYHASDLQPLRKMRSHSTVQSMAAEARRLLRNLKAAQYVISMMEDGAHFYEAHLQANGSEQEITAAKTSPHSKATTMLHDRQRDQIHGVFQEALQFLAVFCSGSDTESQSMVAPHATMIALYVGDLEIAQQVLVAVYASNLTLYRTVPTEVVNAFVTRLASDPTNPRYLHFLETIVLCEETPVHENQLLVLFQLIKSFDSGAILQYFDDPLKSVGLLEELFNRYVRSLKGEMSHPPHHPHGEPPVLHEAASDGKSIAHYSKLLEYHTRLIHLLAACATGKNTRCQEICQQIIPLQVVLDLLALPECTDGIQFALLRFLEQVFITAEDLEAPHEDELRRIFTELCGLCGRVVRQHIKELHDEDVNRHAVVALHKSKRVKDTAAVAKTNVVTPLESKRLYLVMYGAIPAIVAFMHQFPQYADPSGDSMDEVGSDNIMNLVHALVALYTVNAVGEWDLPDDISSFADELCCALDKLTMHTAGQPVQGISLAACWCDGLSRSNRPDLSTLSMATTVSMQQVAEAALAIVDASEPGSASKVAQGMDAEGTAPSPSPGKRARRIHSKQESSVASEDGALSRQSTKKDSASPPLEKLHVMQPMISGMNLGKEAAAVRPGQASAKYLRAGGAAIPQRGLTYRQQDRLVPAQSVPKAQSLLQRLGFRGDNRRHHENPYSRHSALSIQCSPMGKSNSSLFRNYQKQASMKKPGSGGAATPHQHIPSKHQRFDAFDQFLWRLCSDSRVESAMREELNRMVDSILSVEASLEGEYDVRIHSSNVHLTFDQVVTKLVAHVQAFQDASYVKTNLILLDVFCRMIYAADGDWERRHKMQIKLNQLHVTKLVVQLISSRNDETIFERSVELGVALLDGMNAEVQESFHKCWLEQSDRTAFCEKIQSRIEKACQLIHHGYNDRSGGIPSSSAGNSNSQAVSSSDVVPLYNNKPRRTKINTRVPDKQIARLVKRRSVMFMDAGESPAQVAHTRLTSSNASEPSTSSTSLKVVGGPMTLIFRFLQLLCEGHYLNAQRYFISQPTTKPSINLVETTTSFLLDTYLALADLDIGLIIQLFETITEFCQGPCVEAQETVANFKFLSTANALLMHSFVDETNPTGLLLMRRLRASVVVTLLSLLEGRSDRVIHTQLVQELNFDALQSNLTDVYGHFQSEYQDKYAGNVKCSDDFYIEMGFNMYFLLQQLADCFPPASAFWIPRSYGNDRHPHGHGSGDSAMSPRATARHRSYSDAFHFFRANSAKVEIVWNHQRSGSAVAGASTAMKDSKEHSQGDATSNDASPPSPGENEGSLIPYYFPLHPICFCLTEQSKKKLVWHVSRDTNKLHDFYKRSDKLVDEMAHQSRLQYHRSLGGFSRSAELWKRLSFALAVAINLVVLLYYQADGIDSRPYAASQITFIAPRTNLLNESAMGIQIGLYVAGTVQLLLCSLILLCYLVNSAPLLIKKGWKRRIRAQQEQLSKKKASSIHRQSSDAEEKESFQDTEQLLRSLREREEEYDYLFLPDHTQTRPRATIPTTTTTSTSINGLATVATTTTNGHQHHHRGGSSSGNVWQRLWRFLLGPASVVIGNDTRASHAGAVASNQPLRASGGESTTVLYLETVGISLYFLIRSPRVVYYLWQIFISILGAYVNSLFFAFHLLDVVNRYQELSNVLRSIVRPAKVLGVTLVLYLVVVYVFAIVGFYFFREDYNPFAPLTAAQRAGTAPYQCQRLFQCFLISLDQGLKSDGGLGGYLKFHVMGESPGSYARLLFDLLYNTILIVMLLNIVFGVIIDTFASLRTADQEKLRDMQSRCFICSIDAYTFDRATKRGFHDHIYSDHNMWHYLYLFVHIRKKPITEYNGLELYLAMRMAKKDVSFFPNHRALGLEKTATTSHMGDQDVFNNAVELFGSNGDERSDASAIASKSIVGDGTGAERPERRYAAHESSVVHGGSHTSGNDQGAAGFSSHAQRSGSVSKSSQHRRRSSSSSHPCVSPSCSSSRSTHAKLDKLESTIQHLLTTQAELKDHHTRAMERQTQLMEIIASMRGDGAQFHNPPLPSSSSGAVSRRTGRGIINQRSPAATVTSTTTTPSSQAAEGMGRRLSNPPRIFNFDAVVDDLP